MKTPEEYLKKYYNKQNWNELTGNQIREICQAIEEYGKDQYNQALLDATDVVLTKTIEYINSYSESDGDKSTIVDKDSILKLKKK